MENNGAEKNKQTDFVGAHPNFYGYVLNPIYGQRIRRLMQQGMEKAEEDRKELENQKQIRKLALGIEFETKIDQRLKRKMKIHEYQKAVAAVDQALEEKRDRLRCLLLQEKHCFAEEEKKLPNQADEEKWERIREEVDKIKHSRKLAHQAAVKEKLDEHFRRNDPDMRAHYSSQLLLDTAKAQKIQIEQNEMRRKQEKLSELTQHYFTGPPFQATNKQELLSQYKDFAQDLKAFQDKESEASVKACELEFKKIAEQKMIGQREVEGRDKFIKEIDEVRKQQIKDKHMTLMYEKKCQEEELKSNVMSDMKHQATLVALKKQARADALELCNILQKQIDDKNDLKRQEKLEEMQFLKHYDAQLKLEKQKVNELKSKPRTSIHPFYGILKK